MAMTGSPWTLCQPSDIFLMFLADSHMQTCTTFLPSSCLCVLCMYVCVWRHTHVWACLCRPGDNFSCSSHLCLTVFCFLLSFSSPLLLLLLLSSSSASSSFSSFEPGLSLAQNLLLCLGQPSREFQGSPCLHFPSPGFLSACHHILT